MLGCALVASLKNQHDLQGLGDLPNPEATYPYAQIDIRDREKVLDAIGRASPEVIVHTAAYTDVDGCEAREKFATEVNADGTKHVVDAAAEAGAFVIHISTDYVFDGQKQEPYREDEPPRPMSAYGRSKRFGEEHVLAYKKGSLVVRSSWLYGAFGKNFVATVLQHAKQKNKLRVVHDQVGRPTYTNDLAHGISLIIGLIAGGKVREIGPIVHIANDGVASWFDFAREIFQIKRKKVTVEAMTSDELNRPAKRPSYSVLDTSRFEALTGQSLRTWQLALRDYLETYHNK